MKTLAEADPVYREKLTTIFILNIDRPIMALVNDDKVWTGILQVYRNDGLIIKKKYGKVLWNWPFRHLKEIEVEIPLITGRNVITMPD